METNGNGYSVVDIIEVPSDNRSKVGSKWGRLVEQVGALEPGKALRVTDPWILGKPSGAILSSIERHARRLGNKKIHIRNAPDAVYLWWTAAPVETGVAR